MTLTYVNKFSKVIKDFRVIESVFVKFGLENSIKPECVIVLHKETTISVGLMLCMHAFRRRRVETWWQNFVVRGAASFCLIVAILEM